MSQASAGGQSRADVERKLIQKSLQDEDFRQKLLAEPKGTLEQELGTQLPEGVEVRVMEESADTIDLVRPGNASPPEGQSSEISDQELEAVAGGDGGTWGDACNYTVGHI